MEKKEIIEKRIQNCIDNQGRAAAIKSYLISCKELTDLLENNCVYTNCVSIGQKMSEFRINCDITGIQTYLKQIESKLSEIESTFEYYTNKDDSRKEDTPDEENS